MKAVIKTGHPELDHLTVGKEYEIIRIVLDRNENSGLLFEIEDDEGDKINCYEDNCAHLMGGTWQIIKS